MLDTAGVEFIDGRTLVALNRHVAATGATLVLLHSAFVFLLGLG